VVGPAARLLAKPEWLVAGRFVEVRMPLILILACFLTYNRYLSMVVAPRKHIGIPFGYMERIGRQQNEKCSGKI
jgi:hypothetical protein